MQRLPAILLMVLSTLVACAGAEQANPSAAAPALAVEAVAVTTTPVVEGVVQKDAYTLVGPKNFLSGYPPTVGDRVQAVVEIPTGYVDKWEVKNEDGLLHWDMKNGKPRKVKYLGYPCNYGMVPQTVLSKARGGDGDPLDILVLGEAVPRGSVVEVKVIGLFRMHDDGELDVKLVAVRENTPFAEVASIAELQEKFPGVTTIVETWFGNYKGPGVIKTEGFGDVDEATNILNGAVADYREAHGGS